MMSTTASIRESIHHLSSKKRERDDIIDDTEDESKRLAAIKICELTNIEMVPPFQATIPTLDQFETSQQELLSRAFQHRQLINMVYTDTHTVTIEKVEGRHRFLVTYFENDHSIENDFQLVGKCFMATVEQCHAAGLDVCTF